MVTDEELDQLKLFARTVDLEELADEIDTAREIACLLWHWCLWLDDLTATLCNAETMGEVEALRQGCLENSERWRRVRESGMRREPWLQKSPRHSGPA